MMRKFYFIPAALLFACAVAVAQTDSGAIRVLVQDTTATPVPDATVRVTNVATGVVIARSSESDGYATFSPIPHGNYVVDVEKTGFQKTHVTDLALDVDEHKLVRVILPVSSVSTSVDVSDSANIVQSEQGSLGQVIQGEVGVELPLAARRYEQLALLVPGATVSTLDGSTTRGVGWFVANGNYQTQNNFMLEGVDNNEGTNNAQSLSSQVIAPSPDAIAEFKLQTNSFSAEFGRSAGAVVNVVLKSGGNSIHGSAWYYNRDSLFAANAWASNLVGAPKSNLNWNQFGGTFGGPIKKNKIFYFADYEGFRESYSTPFIVTVPTAAEHNGIFYRTIDSPGTKTPFPNNTIPASEDDPIGKEMLALYPAANTAGSISSSGQTIDNYATQAPGTEHDQKGDGKIDYNINEKNVASVRFSYLRQDIFNDGIFPGIADGVGNQGGEFNVNYSLGATWTHIFSPAIVNAARFGWTYTNANFTNASVNDGGAAAYGFSFPSQAMYPGSGGLPLINPSNYNDLGTRGFRPQFQQPTLYQFIDSLSWVHGKHSIRTGFETRQKSNTNFNVSRTVPEYDFNGNFTGEPLADLLLGQVYNFTADTQEIETVLQKAYATYIQDDWKIAPTLTLNLGLRWEYETPFYGKAPYENINFDFQTGQLVHGTGPTDYLVNPDYRDFAPRVGAAWQILPEKLVFRGGFGIFYSGEDPSGSDVDLAANPPNFIPINLTEIGSGPPPILLSQAIPSTIFNNYNTQIISLTARDTDYHAARIYQFNIALQYSLPLKSTLEMAYVGNRGYDEFAENAGNQAPFGLDGSVAANRPYPEWSGITVGSQVARSWYNSLQMKYEKRFTSGWYSLAAYTFASAIDQAGAWGANTTPQIGADFAAENGPQAQTPRQNFTFANTYELPFGHGRRFGSNFNRPTEAVLGGWRLANILTIHTGLPLNVTLSSTGINPANNQNYTFFSNNGGTLRPNRVGDPQTGISPEVNRLDFLNTAAFQVQTLNTPGDSSRDVALGPGSADLDLSLAKQFSFRERQAAEVRFEAFNSLNHTNFGNPGTTFGTSTFGVINSAGSPRIVQMAIRYRF
jgi:Carboxypeptidase regulatory-like domain/TonB dependent receptor